MDVDRTESTNRPPVAVVVPVFDERETVCDIVHGIVATMTASDVHGHVWVIDDGSTDWDPGITRNLTALGPVSVVTRPVNEGKGAVLNWAFGHIASRFMVVIDADGEYLPSDIPDLLAPLLRNDADWVMGVRYRPDRSRPRQYLATYAVNRALSAWFNLLAGRRVTRDLLSGLYAFRTACVQAVVLRERRFAYTPELLWKVVRGAHPRWRDVPVSYRFRSYAAGKTIRWWETFTIGFAILRYRLVRVEGLR